jgi:hypothetical protein
VEDVVDAIVLRNIALANLEDVEELEENAGDIGGVGCGYAAPMPVPS